MLGLAVGMLLGQVARGIAGKGRPGGPRVLFGFRLAAAVGGIGLLAAVRWLCPAGDPVRLDMTGYFGPGPLLTTIERVCADRAGLPVGCAWPVIFFGKFALLALPMGACGAAAAYLLRGRKRR